MRSFERVVYVSLARRMVHILKLHNNAKHMHQLTKMRHKKITIKNK